MTDRPSELLTAERPPDAAEVEAELRRVIDSRCFEQAGRSKEFLRFVVGETLEGRGDLWRMPSAEAHLAFRRSRRIASSASITSSREARLLLKLSFRLNALVGGRNANT